MTGVQTCALPICIVSIVDRQENGEADTAMKLAGLELYSLFSLEQIADEYLMRIADATDESGD